MKVKKKVGELTGVQVARISLVDRGANRVPFRVMKRCASGATTTEDPQVLDFGKLFKKDKAPAASAPTTVAVKAIATVAARVDAVLKAAEAAGLSGFSHRIEKAEGAVALVQDPKVDLGACEVVALTADVSVLVDPSASLLAKAAEAFSNLGDRKFAPGPLMALDTLQDGIEAALAKGETDAVKSATAAFDKYAATLSALPAEVLKLDALLADVEPTAAPKAEGEPSKDIGAEPTPATSTAKADEPTAASTPEQPKADDASKVLAAISELTQKFDGLAGKVTAAQAVADEALALARKSDRPSTIAAPAKPGDVALRLGAAATRKADVPLIDTAFGKAEN